MVYKRDDVDVYIREHANPNSAEVFWPFREMPQMADIISVRGSRYRVKFRDFKIPANQDDRHRIIIWVESI